VYGELVTPILLDFDPDLILVSAGYDGHQDDPLGGLSLSVSGFSRLTGILNEIARRTAGGKILYVLEGGYGLQGLSESVRASILTCLDGNRPGVRVSQKEECEEYLARARQFFSQYWRGVS
jgi:acetoin utilization deacetylase AcuC-like enzyme